MPGNETRMEGFEGRAMPTGYGAVKCQVFLNGNDLGTCWSQQTTYCEGTEHAEDIVIDAIQAAMLAKERPGVCSAADVRIASLINRGENELKIMGLTSSPCTSETREGTPATCRKGDDHGCAEKLIELQNMYKGEGVTFRIVIQADKYYQPHTVGSGAKEASIHAVEAMQRAGIGIVVAPTGS